jgi:hypothetical protein
MQRRQQLQRHVARVVVQQAACCQLLPVVVVQVGRCLWGDPLGVPVAVVSGGVVQQVLACPLQLQEVQQV